MKVEMNSMNTNDVWDLKVIPNGAKIVGYLWVYKTKCDSKGNVERYKVEMYSMSTNDVWDLQVIPNRAKTVGCEWVYKTNCDSKGDVERLKHDL